MKQDAVVVLAFLALALAVTWPIAWNLSSLVPGSSPSDVWDHLWTMNATRRALAGDWSAIFYHSSAYFPVGLLLFPLNLLNELISVPLQAVMGLVPAYNVLCIGQLVVAGWAAYRLALRSVEAPACAFVAGAIFAFSPYALSMLISGIPEEGSTGWIPFYLWMLLRAFDRPSFPRLFVAAGALGLTAIASWSYGAFCVLATVVYAAYGFVGGSSRDRVALVRHLTVVLGFAAMFALPFFLIVHMSLQHPDAAYLSDQADALRRVMRKETFSASLSGLFNPWHYGVISGYTHFCYLGIVPTILAVIGFRARRADPSRRLWGTLAVVFALVALGPVLWILGKPLIRLPYYYAMKWVPLFHYFDFPFRFVVMVNLAIGILAAAGLCRIVGQFPAGLRTPLAAATAIVVVAEYLACASWPLPTRDTRIPVAYVEIAKAPGRGAVLDLPMGFATKGPYFYYQVAHGRPIPAGINSVGPEVVRTVLDPDNVREVGGRWVVPGISAKQVRELCEMGFQFLVWHGPEMEGDTDLGAQLRALGVPVFYEDSDLAVFDLFAYDGGSQS